MRALIIIAVYLLVVFLLLYFNHKMAVRNKQVEVPTNMAKMEKQRIRLYEHRKQIHTEIMYLEPGKGFTNK